MTIDENALIAFEAAATKRIIELKMGEAFCFLTDDGWNDAITAGLEAYEAAKPSPWRPIEEARGLIEEIEVQVNPGGDFWILGWNPAPFGEPGGSWVNGDTLEWSQDKLEQDGAMFRTIEPPTQDATQSSVDRSPAAEED